MLVTLRKGSKSIPKNFGEPDCVSNYCLIGKPRRREEFSQLERHLD